MGWCADFGTWIDKGCRHAMVAGQKSCSCQECGATCAGKFAGCSDVWVTGPVTRAPLPPPPGEVARAPKSAGGPDRARIQTPPAADSPSVDRRLQYLDAAMARMVRELGAVRKHLRHQGPVPTQDDFKNLDQRIDTLGLDLVEALSLMRQTPQTPPTPADADSTLATDVRALAEQVENLAQALRDTQRVTSQQQETLAKLLRDQAGTTRDRIGDQLRRGHPGPSSDTTQEERAAVPMSGEVSPGSPRLPPPPSSSAAGAERS